MRRLDPNAAHTENKICTRVSCANHPESTVHHQRAGKIEDTQGALVDGVSDHKFSVVELHFPWATIENEPVTGQRLRADEVAIRIGATLKEADLKLEGNRRRLVSANRGEQRLAHVAAIDNARSVSALDSLMKSHDSYRPPQARSSWQILVEEAGPRLQMQFTLP